MEKWDLYENKKLVTSLEYIFDIKFDKQLTEILKISGNIKSKITVIYVYYCYFLHIKLIQNIFRVGNHSNLKVFTATGDSMEPTIFSGDDVLVNFGDCNFNNGGVFVIEKFGDWFIKRLRLRFDGNLEIISDNNKYETEIIKYDSGTVVNIKGRVIKNLSRGL